MRIIKPGRPCPSGVLHGECPDCGCVLECSASEASLYPDDDGLTYIIDCPTLGCNRLIRLATGEWEEPTRASTLTAKP